MTEKQRQHPPESKPEAPKTLGFEFMDEMIDELIGSQKRALPGPLERWSFIVGLLGAGVGMLLGVLLGGWAGVLAAVIGLAIELIGFAMALVLMVRREWHMFRHARRVFACELDEDFEKYQRCVATLRQFPKVERDRRLRYVRDRRRVMQHRLGLFSGGLERLGVLPVLAVLYLQFRDWEWGDWSMLADINLLQGLLIWALLLAYAMGWHLVRLRSRTEAYELLLAEASQQDEKSEVV